MHSPRFFRPRHFIILLVYQYILDFHISLTHFSIPVKIGEENAQQVVEKGDIGYWPPGNAFCIFFGLTPASSGDEIRAASPVNIFGSILGNPDVLKKAKQGEEIKIEKAD